MSKKKSITVIGGDNRYIYMIEDFYKKGYSITSYGVINDRIKNISYTAASLKEAMERSNIIIGPIPFCRNKIKISQLELYEDSDIEQFMGLLNRNHFVFGGVIPNKLTDYCLNYDIYCCDFMSIDGFALLNAIATAEGSIAEAISTSTINLHQSRCLVIGYGRCAQILARKLKAMDAEVCVAARRFDARALAKANGLDIISFDKLEDKIINTDFIFNTVPAMILSKDKLIYVPSHATIIDIASAPGGVDYEFAKEINICAKNCLSLPGKYAPKSSGEIIVHIVENIINERSGEYETNR